MDVLRRNNVTVSGSGPPVVFAHGFGCDQLVWHRVAPQFEDSHTVVLFDYVGAGGSEREAYSSERYATLDGYADDVLEVCDALGLERTAIVGHSVSGTICGIAAARRPSRFDRIVMVAPSPRFEDDPPDYRTGFSRDDLEGLLRLMDANFMGWATALAQMAVAPEVLSRELRESFCSADPLFLREFARATFLSDHREVLARIDPPTLVLQCAMDDLVPVSVGRYIVEELPAGIFQLLDIPGHMPHMSHPHAVVDAIRRFLDAPHEDLVAP